MQSLCQECYNSFKEQAAYMYLYTTLQVAAASIGQLPDANSRLHDSSLADELVTDKKENEDVGMLISNVEIVRRCWICTSRQNYILHVSFNAPVKKKMESTALQYVQNNLFVDPHSKWPEIVEVKSITAEKECKQYGIPEQVVSENSPQFILEILFVSKYLSTNGLAE